MAATLAVMDLRADIALFYADFAVPVTHRPLSGNAVVGDAIFDQPGTVLVNGEMLATDYALRYPAVTFQTVRRGDRFDIAGATYTAREHGQPATIDGLEHIVPLAKGGA